MLGIFLASRLARIAGGPEEAGRLAESLRRAAASDASPGALAAA